MTRNDAFTRIRCDEILSIEEAKGARVQTRIEERFEEPVVVRLPLEFEQHRLEELYHLAMKHPGKKPLKLLITSKLQDVEIESNVCVSAEFEEQARQMGLQVA